MPRRRLTFAVPATSGTYAPEVLYCNPSNLAATDGDMVAELAAFVESIPTGATVEVDLLKPGGSMGTSGDWYTAVKSFNAVGLAALVSLASWVGVRLRVKSGGTAGAAAVSAAWR